MPRLLISALRFGAFTILVYLLLFKLLTALELNDIPFIYRTSEVLAWKGGAGYQKFQEFEPAQFHDVIILGSSHAYRGYDPKIFENFGFSSFNLGTNAQTPMQSYFIAKNYLNGENTGFLIFDIYHGTLRTKGLESTARLTQNIDSDLAALQIGLAQRDIRTVNMLTLRFMQRNAAPIYLDSTYVGQGFCENRDSLAHPFTLPDTTEVDFIPYDRQLHYLDQLLSYVSREQIPCCIVTHPAPSYASRQLHQRMVLAINPILSRYNIPYLDFSQGHDLDDYDHFYDQSHLNQAGAEKFSQILIEELKSRHLLGGA